MFCVGLWFTSDTLSVTGISLGLLATMLSVAALSQFGAIFAALVLQYRQVTAIFGFFNLAFQFLTGMFIPFQLLPMPLQVLGWCLPITFGMDMLRYYVMRTKPLMPVEYEWLALFVQLLFMSIMAKFVVAWLERNAKEQGLHYI